MTPREVTPPLPGGVLSGLRLPILQLAALKLPVLKLPVLKLPVLKLPVLKLPVLKLVLKLPAPRLLELKLHAPRLPVLKLHAPRLPVLKMPMLFLLGLLGVFALGQSALSLDANGQLEDPALQTRFERITKELRCLVCQNESIADSNVELAADLRRQVREMLVAGRSDDAIFRFMTDRYGEFVRFAPPLEAKTLLIWGAPFIALLAAIFIVYRVVLTRSRMPLDE
jgi:cytochrome c-type biogenesis protein CcmH